MRTQLRLVYTQNEACIRGFNEKRTKQDPSQIRLNETIAKLLMNHAFHALDWQDCFRFLMVLVPCIRNQRYALCTKKMLHVPNAWNPAAQYCQWVTDYLSIIAYGSDLGSGKKHSIMYSKTFFFWHSVVELAYSSDS